MPRRRRTVKAARNNYRMLKTSWGVQVKLFFENSTLHGVRYIAENGRPFIEKFMWFTCVVIGTIATLVIIYNLWEKFQTTPTITGLDTDFHNWDVPFPALTVCQVNPISDSRIEDYIRLQSNSNVTDKEDVNFYSDLTKLSLANWKSFTATYSKKINVSSDISHIKNVIFQLVNKCEEVFDKCYWKSEPYNCCEGFFPVFTESGFCYTFNSRHYERNVPGGKELPSFNKRYIKETDVKWAMKFQVRSVDTHYAIYLLNSEEIAGIDVRPQHMWDFSVEMISFSVKETYTTQDTAQLSIKQRRCAFSDEIKLRVDDVYSYSACTRECRMDTAFRLCGCIPFFYPEVGSYKHCGLKRFKCIATHLEEIKSVDKCACYLGCSNTVYEVEKFDDTGTDDGKGNATMECQFVSWPMARYKREVLFGWVDLLVSFGGIAGLFLGFSLLSGVEILYYFTVRACCMVVRERKELEKIRLRAAAKPLPEYDLSLVPYFISDPLPGNGINEVAKHFYQHNLLSASNKIGPIGKGAKLKQPHEAFIPPFGIEFLN